LIFTNEKAEDLWEDRIKTILKTAPKSDIEKLIDLISIIIYNQGNDDLSKLYAEIGLENFSKVVSLFSNKTIKFPDKEDFKDLLMIVLCFYYKEMKNMKWEDIRELFNFREFSSIKYGKGIAKIKSLLEETLTDKLKEIYGDTNYE
jgi:hypothetical protein